MKIIKRVITILVTIILLTVLSFNLFNFISIKILDNDLPTINGYALLEVISGSMEPKIKKGDIVIIDTKINNYKVNDIITFKDINGSFVTHRIIEINDNELITKGDANNTIDDPINKKDIMGRYVYHVEGIGALIKSLRSPFTLIMILVIGILLCVLASTDSKGNVILTEEEKEYIDFLEFKNKKKKLKDTKNTDGKLAEPTNSKVITQKKNNNLNTNKTSSKKIRTEAKNTTKQKHETKVSKTTTTKSATNKTKSKSKELVTQKKTTSNVKKTNTTKTNKKENTVSKVTTKMKTEK